MHYMSDHNMMCAFAFRSILVRAIRTNKVMPICNLKFYVIFFSISKQQVSVIDRVDSPWKQ